MSSQPQRSISRQPDAPVQNYLVGILVGGLFGLLSAYFFSRASEEDRIRTGGSSKRVSTGEVLGLLVAAVAMVRQITEMGRGPSKKS
jgi:H+/Cl- antiporter ClcA